MKPFLLLIALLGTSSFSHAVTLRSTTSEDSIEIERKLNLAVQKFKDSLKENNKGSDYLTELHNEFALDTFKVEERQRIKLSIDYTTRGMVSTTYDASSEYDKLLNKYYNRLINGLDEKDKEILRTSQRNWIKFRDSEKKLNDLLSEGRYSGGGTIQRVIRASRDFELTKSRVIELYAYLTRKFEY